MLAEARPVCELLARQYPSRTLSLDDRRQICLLAACEALQTYDPHRSPWLLWCRIHAHQALTDALSRSRLVRLPNSAVRRGVQLPSVAELTEVGADAGSPEDRVVAAEAFATKLSAKSNRVGRMLALRAQGFTFEEIAKREGLSRQRIHKLLNSR